MINHLNKLLLFSVLILNGCAGVPERAPVGDRQLTWQQRTDSLESIHSWDITGRFAMQNEQESWSGVLQWHQQESQYLMRFIAPFGQGTVELQGGQNGALLRLSEQEQYTADDADSLLQEQLGWRVPVPELQRWVRGLPGDSPLEEFNLDEFGRVQQLRQAGWQVRFLRYAQVQGQELPDKIFIKNHRLGLRLVIESWQLGESG